MDNVESDHTKLQAHTLIAWTLAYMTIDNNKYYSILSGQIKGSACTAYIIQNT